MTRAPEPTGLDLVDGLVGRERPTIEDYCRASAEYIRNATELGGDKGKAAQIRLSNALAEVTLGDLRDHGLGLDRAVAGEREVGGGLRSVKADVSEISEIHGLTLAVEIKPVHLAVGRAIWNRFGDVRTFAVNIHLKFPFAVVGGILTLPTTERVKSGSDTDWKSTSHLVSRAVARFMRAGGRETEGDAPHLLEGIAVVAFDRETGAIEPDLPPVASGLRWEEFIESIAVAYDARFGEV
ncbi:MAG: hypothetical protein P1T08_18100 [Acidimicrobiia bacterium]|nr:hypothetical protein [Acidimicrobiia bacterium]